MQRLELEKNHIHSDKRCRYSRTLYASFILASTAVTMGIGATKYFMMKVCTIIKQGEAEKIRLKGMPSLKEVMNKAVKSGVKLRICKQSCVLLGLKREDFLEPAKIVGAARLNDKILDADAVICF